MRFETGLKLWRFVAINCAGILGAICLSSLAIADTIKPDGSDQTIHDQPTHEQHQAVSPGDIRWQPWADDIFRRSEAEHKLVILDLHAVWCHWCHVMDEKTYSNPTVKKLIEAHFIPVSVDQDSRPDLANRYEDYGWPATIIFNSKGQELKLLSGFLPPEELIPDLQSCIKSPDKISHELATPKGHFADTSALAPGLKAEMNKRFVDLYDTKNGGWTFGQKYLPRENVEYAMVLAQQGDKLAEKRAKEVLRLQVNLLDPVWGGMYQYSTDNDWKHAHFEKIMEVQAGNLRIYSLAYLLWKDPEHLRVAEKIASYLFDFLQDPESAFYTSQDADLVPGQHSGEYFALNNDERRKKGIPRVDKHIYARENGMAIESLTSLYAASGQAKYLACAERCATWILEHRLDGDRFTHETLKDTQSYFADNVSMGRAFLALYAATGNRGYLERAEKTANYISHTFRSDAGFVTATPASAAGNAVNLDENITAARFFNLLRNYSGRPADKESADLAMHYVATPWVAKKRMGTGGGILLADLELNSSPPHIVVVGSKDDAVARSLFAESQKCPTAYKQTEFYDSKEGKLPASEIDYPELPRPAAFMCSGSVCSAPVYTVEKLDESISKSITKSISQPTNKSTNKSGK